ncbi:hypothetical protein [Fluviicola sp.]|jgi:hypothetical protein|uniref:hypothetical protein n=1 Tax=Fluviicola sp. TaxID=1917219 RepID=UPI002820F1CC|nr:hypothetical protein [Fluviicola sp.]MDR0801078.1 hypothetical protein [Fluviicola sp.]
MEKIIFATALASVSLFTGCEKETIQKTTTDSKEIHIEKIDKPRLSNIACAVKDPNGNGGIGTRCSSAPGNDCKEKTECQIIALSSDFQLPEGMSLEEFNKTWNTEEGKAYLEKLGYSQQDAE